MYSAESEAMDEALGKPAPKLRAIFSWGWQQNTDAESRNIPGGNYRPYILKPTPAAKNQEVYRPVTENDKLEFQMEWAQFEQNSRRSLEVIRAELMSRVDRIDELIGPGERINQAPKKRGRPKKVLQ